MIFSKNDCTCDNNFVYLNKIFYNKQEKGSPILTPLNSTESEMTQQLTIDSKACTALAVSNGRNCSHTSSSYGSDCGCNTARNANNTRGCGCSCDCCCDFALTQDTVFDISNTYVIVHSFILAEDAIINAADVTVEGIPITGLTRNGNQYVGDLSGIMGEITRCACHSPCTNTCPGNYVMINAFGPWLLNATIVVEGTAYNNGPSCHFKICFNTAVNTPIEVTGSATFAFCGVEIPCQVSGISPSLIFDFDACIKILNPEITINCTGDACIPVLTGSIVVTPTAGLQITRPSLFNLGPCEVEMPCDDLGQCNPCNEQELPCIDAADNCCCNTASYSF